MTPTAPPPRKPRVFRAPPAMRNRTGILGLCRGAFLLVSRRHQRLAPAHRGAVGTALPRAVFHGPAVYLDHRGTRPLTDLAGCCRRHSPARSAAIMPQVALGHLSVLRYKYPTPARAASVGSSVRADMAFCNRTAAALTNGGAAWTIIVLVNRRVYRIGWLSRLVRTKPRGRADLAK